MRRYDQQDTSDYKDLCTKLNKTKKDIRQLKQTVEGEDQLKLLSEMNKRTNTTEFLESSKKAHRHKT